MPLGPARIPYHRASVSIGHLGRLLDGFRSGLQRSPVRPIDIVDVEVEKSPHRVAEVGPADHDVRVADSQHGRHVRPELPGRIERDPQEIDESSRIVNDESGSDAMPALRKQFSSSLNLRAALPTRLRVVVPSPD